MEIIWNHKGKHKPILVLGIEVYTKGRPTSTKGKPTKWAETRPRISKPAQILGGFWATFGRLFVRAGFRPSPSLQIRLCF
jgi:hypothetical protein